MGTREIVGGARNVLLSAANCVEVAVWTSDWEEGHAREQLPQCYDVANYLVKS